MRVFHVSTISPNVIAKTLQLLASVDYSYTFHAEKKRNEKNVAHWKYILKHGSLIELKIDSESKNHRALLRTNDGHCAVFCWNEKKVITTWYNDPNDNHFTIRPEQYERGVKA